MNGANQSPDSPAQGNAGVLGAWQGREIDALTYVESLRAEWPQPADGDALIWTSTSRSTAAAT